MKNSMSAIQQRQMNLLHHLQQARTCTVAELADYLHVSQVTVRRDLEELEGKKLLARYFGGAEAVTQSVKEDEPAYMASITQYLDCKKAVAKAAAERLQDGDTVFINSSATALLIYPYITKDVMIITNNGRSLQVERPANVGLLLTGGEVNGNKKSLTGQVAVDMLSRITASKCILGVSGISVEGGITSRVMQETIINRTMLQRTSGEKIVICDHTKIGMEHNFFSSDLRDITHLITDNQADPARIKRLQDAGLIVQLVEPITEDMG